MNKNIKTLIWSIILLHTTNPIAAQPVRTIQQRIQNVVVYRDLKDPKIWYYAPGGLTLGTEKNTGKPRFSLIQMRYTGSSVTGDQNTARFVNVLQAVVVMEQVTSTQLEQIRQQLGGSRISLRPMPIRRMEAAMILPEAGAQGQQLSGSGSFEGADANANVYWTERTYTLRLDNNAAQLLRDKIKEGRVVMGLNYAFFSDIVTEKADGTKGPNGNTLLDSIPKTEMISSGSTPVSLDFKRWPDLSQQIDLNETAGASYAVLEVRCDDFSNELRPDLALKIIDLEASGVENQPVKVSNLRFSATKPDQNNVKVRFPYAVKLSKPYRYRITEYTKGGKMTQQPWQTRDNWSELLDITTPEALNRLTKYSLFAELDPALWQNNTDITEISLVLTGAFSAGTRSITCRWQKGETDEKFLSLVHNRDVPVTAQLRWKIGETVQQGNVMITGSDNYLYVSELPK